jgi:hypothetical protein
MKKIITTLDQLIDKAIGPKGSRQRKKFETGYEAFKRKVLLQQARTEKQTAVQVRNK